MQKKITLLRYWITLASCVVLYGAKAQQAVQYSMVALNPYQYNVGYGGLSNSLEATAVVRAQWNGIEGAPLSQNINAHLPLYYLHGGFGINIDNDQLGAVRTTAAQLSYSYHIAMPNENIFSVGIGGGIVQQAIDGTKLTTPDGIYSNGQILHNDNFLANIKQSAIAPTFQIGTYFKNKRLQIGLSANNLTESYEKYTIKNLKIRLIKNIFCNFALDFEIGNKLILSPVLFVKSDVIQTQLEGGLRVLIENNVTLGVSYRGYTKTSTDALVCIGGIRVNEKIKVAYAYDLGLSKLNSVQNGSHEIIIQYNLNKVIGGGLPEKIIYNPRFL